MIRRKMLLLCILLAIVITGCEKNESQDAKAAYQKASEAIKALNETKGIYLQFYGSLKTAYKDSSNLIGFSGLHKEKRTDKDLVDSVISYSYTDGTHCDYYYMSDGENNVYYYTSGDDGSTGSTAEEDTSEDTDSKSGQLSTEEFQQAIAYSKQSIPFSAGEIKKCKSNTEDGKTSWLFTLNKKGGGALAKNLLEAANLIDTSQTEIDFTVNEAECKFTYNKDDELYNIKYSVKTDMTAEGKTVSADYMISYMVLNKGDEVTVDVSELEKLLKGEEQDSAEK
jgi:hypothetical protein